MLATAVLVISGYYAGTSHSEIAGEGFAGYVLSVLAIYGIWKAWSASSGKKEISYSVLAMVAVAVTQLALLSGFFPFPAGFSAP